MKEDRNTDFYLQDYESSKEWGKKKAYYIFVSNDHITANFCILVDNTITVMKIKKFVRTWCVEDLKSNTKLKFFFSIMFLTWFLSFVQHLSVLSPLPKEMQSQILFDSSLLPALMYPIYIKNENHLVNKILFVYGNFFTRTINSGWMTLSTTPESKRERSPTTEWITSHSWRKQPCDIIASLICRLMWTMRIKMFNLSHERS